MAESPRLPDDPAGVEVIVPGRNGRAPRAAAVSQARRAITVISTFALP